MKFRFSKSGGYVASVSLKREIIQAVESSPEIRHEISRVFQMANRRIQNVEKSGGFSPAVYLLGNRGESFSKFRMSGHSWTELKEEYATAVAFLQQPTSTATGTREYNEQIKKAKNLTDTEFNALVDDYKGKLTSLTGSAFVDKYLKAYKDVTAEFEAETESAAAQMESDAIKIADAMEENINNIVNNIEDDITKVFDGLDIPF